MSNFKNYILLKPICAGKVSVVIVIEKYYNLSLDPKETQW